MLKRLFNALRFSKKEDVNLNDDDFSAEESTRSSKESGEMMAERAKEQSKEEITQEKIEAEDKQTEAHMVDCILYKHPYLHVIDKNNTLTSLPDDIFEHYTDATVLMIDAPLLENIPVSINKLTKVNKLIIKGGKFRSLPDLSMLTNLEEFELRNNNLINLDKELCRFPTDSKLNSMIIGSYWGKKFPKAIINFKHLKKLSLGKKNDLQELIIAVTKMPQLEKLNIDYSIKVEEFNAEFMKLDFLKEIELKTYFPNNIFPACFAITKHVIFTRNNSLNEALAPFREKFNNMEVSDEARQILFSFQVKNFLELKKLLPNMLDESFKSKQKKGIVLLTKVKGLTKKRWKELLDDTPFYSAELGAKGNLIYVVGSDTEYDVFKNLILTNKDVVFTDHLQEFIIKLEDPWLLQGEGEELNDKLLNLMASNQIENYKIAFEIIESGGANRTIQSLLAAIMTSYPDKKVAKKAEQLYGKYGSSLFIDHLKKSSISLRRSGQTLAKLERVLKHPDIDDFMFRLMHLTIASDNPTIKDIQPNVLNVVNDEIVHFPDEIQYFGNIHEINIYACPNLKLDSIFTQLKKLSGLKSLSIKNSHLEIPSSIGELVQLDSFICEQNQFEEVNKLSLLSDLKTLSIAGCKVDDFSWIEKLQNLESLNLNNNKLKDIPSGVYQLPALSHLFLMKNKISETGEGILNLKQLKHLDLSNNLIKTIDYRLFTSGIETLLLRSNKFDLFDIEELRSSPEKVTLKKLNVAKNLIPDFSLKDKKFPDLKELDISYNKIKILHPSVFENTVLSSFIAGYNQINDIPDVVSKRRMFTKFWIQNNQLTELRKPIAHLIIDNADFNNNQIEKLHSDFFNEEVAGFVGRVYWKMKNNPVSDKLSGVSGLHGF